MLFLNAVIALFLCFCFCFLLFFFLIFFFFQAEDGIRDLVRSRGLGDVYKRQVILLAPGSHGAQVSTQLG